MGKLDEIFTKHLDLSRRVGNYNSDQAKQAIQNWALEQRIDELKKLWNSTQPELVPSGTEPYEIAPTLHKRIEELENQLERANK